MTELETIARAQMYLEKLANGVNPLTDAEVGDSDVVNNVRISRCLFYTKYPLNALTNLLARNFAEQGGGRRHTGVCQGRQHRYAEFNAINVKVF